jgi:hypothetical protein
VELNFCKVGLEGVLRSWTLRSVARVIDTFARGASIRYRPGPIAKLLRKTARSAKKTPMSSKFIALSSPVGSDVGMHAPPRAARRQRYSEAGRKTQRLSKEAYIPSLGQKEIFQYDEHLNQHTTNTLK